LNHDASPELHYSNETKTKQNPHCNIGHGNGLHLLLMRVTAGVSSRIAKLIKFFSSNARMISLFGILARPENAELIKEKSHFVSFLTLPFQSQAKNYPV
jgi:hypothetical protein